MSRVKIEVFQNSEKCGPLSSVVDFSELISAELVPTRKREIVPDDMFYNLKICIKFGAGETIVPRVQIWLCNPDSRLSTFSLNLLIT
jgi:hypothetical protein